MKVYLDNNRATMPDTQVIEAMQPLYTAHYADPSAEHAQGVASHHLLVQAQEKIRASLHATDADTLITHAFGGGVFSVDDFAYLGCAARGEPVDIDGFSGFFLPPRLECLAELAADRLIVRCDDIEPSICVFRRDVPSVFFPTHQKGCGNTQNQRDPYP